MAPTASFGMGRGTPFRLPGSFPLPIELRKMKKQLENLCLKETPIPATLDPLRNLHIAHPCTPSWVLSPQNLNFTDLRSPIPPRRSLPTISYKSGLKEWFSSVFPKGSLWWLHFIFFCLFVCYLYCWTSNSVAQNLAFSLQFCSPCIVSAYCLSW